tara:strand:- start:17125 stop:18912 length:1788 start_codon:yes stop_codon:yes gene_type:complete
MCGIFGINKKTDQSFINKFINLQNHRGPDSKNFYSDYNVTLIHNRLSIIDIEHGNQPMLFNNKVIVYNGEIFNSPGLRKLLQNEGYQFSSNNSDTEVLLKLYDSKGIDMLNELNGMFAFVIFDIKKNLFFGAVDQFSNKPLYYNISNDRFSFSSEIKTILNLDYVKKDISIESVKNYFQLQYIPFEKTIYKNINKIKNSNFFIYDLQKKTIEIKKYYKKKKIIKFETYQDVINAGKSAICNSIDNWSLSDVPITCSLSGGLDSSLITTIFSQNTNKKIDTITVGFENEDKIHDEREFARLITNNINCDHQEIVVKPNEILNDMNIIFENLCEPYAGSLASWYVYKNIKKNKVIFTGTGGDELFGNYGKWKNYFISDFFLKNFIQIVGKQKFRDLKYFHGYLYKKIFYEKEINELFLENSENKKNLNYSIHNLLNLSKFNPKKNIQEIDLNLQLPWEFLYITDRLSMMNSVEARTPFLDEEMINYIENVPSKYLSKITNSKKLLKDIAKDYIPNEIINRKKKGFVLPKENWLKNELNKELKYYSSKEFITKQNIFSYSQIVKLIYKFSYSKKNNFFTEQVWTFFIFQFWYEKNILS